MEHAFVGYYPVLFSYRAPNSTEFQGLHLSLMTRLDNDRRKNLQRPILLCEFEKSIDHFKPENRVDRIVWERNVINL